jgi:pilus assembly protein Flp/PilA
VFQRLTKLSCGFFNNHQEFYMKKLAQASKKFWKDESGATAIEYGLIAALVGLAIIVGATALGGKLGTLFTNIGEILVPTPAK